MCANRIAAGGLAADRDPCRIASERSDVFVNPTQSRLLIHQAEVAGILGDVRMGEEPQRAEPVVEADPDDARFLDDLSHVRLVRAAVDEPSPVDEHIDRQSGVGGDVRRSPHIDEEAIFRFRSWAVCAFRGGAVGAEGFRLPHILPASSRLRGAPAPVADRGRGIGNSEESVDGAAAHAPDRTRFRPRHKPVRVLRDGRFPGKTDHAGGKSQAQCTHNSPPVLLSNTGGVARRLNFWSPAGSRRAPSSFIHATRPGA
jgi:hypothetical protein